MTQNKTRILVNWFLVLAYCSAVFFLSSSASPQALPSFANADKIMHFIAFFILGILFFRAYRAWKMKPLYLVVLTLISSTLFGALIEIRQYYLPYRSAEINDIFADVVGCLAGIAVYLVFIRINHLFAAEKKRTSTTI
ncbi:MAG: VanZ family protein [Desulfobacterales bacterium]